MEKLKGDSEKECDKTEEKGTGIILYLYSETLNAMIFRKVVSLFMIIFLMNSLLKCIGGLQQLISIV